MAQIELYHFWDSFCSFKVRICLEEKALPWTGHFVDLMAFENLKPSYLVLNRKGVVPTVPAKTARATAGVETARAR